jgi:hypothetical protein
MHILALEKYKKYKRLDCVCRQWNINNESAENKEEKQMAKRKPRRAGGKPKYRKADISRMERMAVRKANKALSAIEIALSSWNASSEKPPEMEVRIERLRQFYDELAGWEKKALKTMAGRGEVGERVAHLREFSDICHAYA